MIEPAARLIDSREITISPAPASHAELLLYLARALHLEEGHPLTPAGEAAVRRIVEGELLARAWIVRVGGLAVGYLVITLGYSIEYAGRDGFLDELCLTREVRGRGIGKKLMAFALMQAAQLGIGTLHLEVERDNECALRLYRAAGFEETGRRLMRRRLEPGPT